MRFDYDNDHQVAAAVLLALDKDADSHTWMTEGRQMSRDDLALTHDSWDPENKPFPPASYITIPELRALIGQWAFGDVFPPPAATWIPVPHEQIGW